MNDITMQRKNEEFTNYANVQLRMERFIKEKVKDKNVVVGLSGGIDSSLACVLAKNALGAKKVHGLVLTNSKFAQEVGIKQVKDFAKKHGIIFSEIDISKVRSIIMSTLDEDVHKPTVDVRLCDLYLRLYAKQNDCIYLGTINATERLTGWFPKGALIGDYDLLGDLFKMQIKELATHMGLTHLVPTVAQEATHICSGCGELPEFSGISYDDLDKMLLIYRAHPANFKQECKKAGFKQKDYVRILRRMSSVSHKYDAFPLYPRIN